MRRAPVLAVLALGTALLAGCGSGSHSADPSGQQSDGASASATAAGTAGGTAGPAITGGYVALGDSYSAAPGVPTVQFASGCVRSTNNYPHLIAAALPGLALTDVTCSAATTSSLSAAQHTAAALSLHVPPQLDALSATTRYVTVGIGGNDVGLFNALVGCMTKGDCKATYGDQADSAVETIGEHVTAALQAVHAKAPHAEVALVGYPQLVPASGSCAALPLQEADRAFLHQLFIDISQRMAQAAKDADARFVDVLDASRGHDICSADPWINGPHNTAQAFAFHPFEEEQRAVAALVVKALG
ncbi:SGNH/GDSL hydrolase family protein [Nocardioides sp. BP30]|uniref:SGNH/GDSL hydrolase family protein n=1 Tax=Nocardioides sp. BP30 TaxID=3036374 RepID=UPI00246960F9|nr:SGNH/GDSL hydrolase family protein [Nocardioides sp. BP30]WGL52333.1 SGNH/GDSL hydrolase family protein [Nocardioides sp. BP30]